ncbi:hypothetical protein BJ742DRAFT_742379 [Cladochytrium replicatum]|nr:hypothetical protein BJ742DRAFT_742379 [Cladochytrium replicatum]
MHLAHLIRWNDLIYCVSEPAGGANPISMPTGNVCEQIHLRKKRHRLIVERHPYLQHSVCTDDACTSDRFEERLYHFKSSSDKTRLQLRIHHQPDTRKRLESFMQSFFDAMKSIGEANATRKHLNQNSLKEEIDQIELTCEIEREKDYELVYYMLSRNRLDLVLQLPSYNRRKVDLQWVLNSKITITQAVGNYWSFLIYYLLITYISVNLALAAADSKADTSSLPLKRIHDFGVDCDGRYFLHTQRHALQHGVLMKDAETTRSMLKEIFRFMADFYVLQIKVLGEVTAKTWWLEKIPIDDFQDVLVVDYASQNDE